MSVFPRGIEASEAKGLILPLRCKSTSGVKPKALAIFA